MSTYDLDSIIGKMSLNHDDLMASAQGLLQMVSDTLAPLRNVQNEYQKLLKPLVDIANLRESIDQFLIPAAHWRDMQSVISKICEPYSSMVKGTFPIPDLSENLTDHSHEDKANATDTNYVEIDESLSHEIEERYYTIPSDLKIRTGKGTILVPTSMLISIISILVMILIALVQGKSISPKQGDQIISNQEIEIEVSRDILQSVQNSSESAQNIEELLVRLVSAVENSHLSSEVSGQDECP